MEVCLELAAEFGRPVDLHMDEHTGSALDLADLARMVAGGFPQAVAASHCSSLGMQAPEVQDRVAAEVAGAGISVISCPGTNLHLQAQAERTAKPRGITALRALIDAGVTVAGGGDNIKISSIRSAAATPCKPPRCWCSAGSWTSQPPTSSSARRPGRRWACRPATTSSSR